MKCYNYAGIIWEIQDFLRKDEHFNRNNLIYVERNAQGDVEAWYPPNNLLDENLEAVKIQDILGELSSLHGRVKEDDED